MFTLKFFDIPGDKRRYCDMCQRYEVYLERGTDRVWIRYWDITGRQVERLIPHKMFAENSSGKTVDRIVQDEFSPSVDKAPSGGKSPEKELGEKRHES